MVVEPTETPVTNPVVLTEATVGTLDTHVLLLVTSRAVPPTGVAVRMNWPVWLAPATVVKVKLGGVRFRVTAVTVIFVVPVMPFRVALIVVVPAATVVATPPAVIVATLILDDFQVAVLLTTAVVASE